MPFPFKLFRSVDYFGHRIKLRRLYFDETSYALDPENIPMAEASRLAGIIERLPFGPLFHSKADVFRALADMRFPGYGSFYANQLHSDPGQRLELMSIVIPRMEKDRYFVLEEQPDGGFLVVDDFIHDSLGVVKARRQGSCFEFLSRSDDILFVKPAHSA